LVWNQTEGKKRRRQLSSRSEPQKEEELTALFPHDQLKSESLEGIEEVNDVFARDDDSVVGAVV